MIKSAGIDFSLLDLLENWVLNQNLKPFNPGKMEDTDPEIIFDRDMEMLEEADFIVADVNEPSHGVGMEIMYAYEHGMPVICVMHKNNRPFSRLGDGSPHLFVIEYESKEDLDSKLRNIKLENTVLKFCETCQKKTIHHEDVCKRC
jgi:nucleoside 2-deoxyribosyltransferase